MYPGYFLCTSHREAVSKILWFLQHRFSHPLYSFWVLTYYLSVHGLVTLVVCCHFCFFFLRYFDRILFLISADFQSYDDEIEMSKPRSYEKAPTMKSVISCICISLGFQLFILIITRKLFGCQYNTCRFWILGVPQSSYTFVVTS